MNDDELLTPGPSGPSLTHWTSNSLSRSDCLDYNMTPRVVRKADDRMADKRVELGDDQAAQAVVRGLIDDLLARVDHRNLLFGQLSAESLLTVTTDWKTMNQ